MHTLWRGAFLYVSRGSNFQTCPLGKCIRVATPFFVPLSLYSKNGRVHRTDSYVQEVKTPNLRNSIGTNEGSMFIAKDVGRVNGVPVWEYSTKEGSYLVREYGNSQCGKRNYIVKSPSGKLYCFSDYSGDLPELFLFIRQGKADKERYSCGLESIFDEF